MTMKLILSGFKLRLKVYAGIALLYLLYAVLSAFSEPTPQMDNILDWFTWSYEIFGVKIYAMTFVLLLIATAALLVAEIIMVARDFYGPRANLLISLPVNGKQVVGSRFGLFFLGFLLLLILDFPFRWSFYRTLAASDLVYSGILTGITWIVLFTLVPLLNCLVIATAKFQFDLSAGWMIAMLALGYAVFFGLGNLVASATPPLAIIPTGSAAHDTNPLIPVLLLAANVLIYWSGTKVIDRAVTM